MPSSIFPSCNDSRSIYNARPYFSSARDELSRLNRHGAECVTAAMAASSAGLTPTRQGRCAKNPP